MPETADVNMPEQRPSKGYGRLNGSGAIQGSWEAQDITLSYVPLLVAFSIAAAVAVGAFQVGKLFSRYEIERGQILERLDSLEGKLDKILPIAGKTSLKKKHDTSTE